MKVVYVLGGNYDASGMCSVITKKINWLAEHTDWEITALLTESPNGREFYFPIHPSVKIVNFNLNYDELDVMSKFKKIKCYRTKQKQYKRLFTDFLMDYRPDIVVSAMRREVNFLNDIKDGSKKVGELHFCRSTYRIFTHPKLPAFVCRAITRHWQSQLLKQIRKLDAFVVLTDEDRRAWGGEAYQNIHVIPNFIQQMPQQVSSCQNKTVVAVGRYTLQKGFDLLFQAWKKVEEKCPDWHLQIYGAGERAPYQQMADDMKLERVHLNGTTKQVNDVFASASVIAFSSRYEGFGMVLIEAMSCGIPAVSFACPCGPSDIIQDGVDGYLVKDFDVDAFADRLIDLINDNSKRVFMGKLARKNMNRFLEEDIMQTWKTFLEHVAVSAQNSSVSKP